MKLTLHSLLIAPIGAVVLAMAFFMFAAACSNEASKDVPGPAYDFVVKYWPGSEIESYDRSGGVQTVKIKDGPQVYFDNDNKWLRIDGRGSVLPSMLLYDQLPSTLFSYLEGLEQTDEVFALDRDNTTYTVVMLNSTITYNADTEEINFEKTHS